MFGILFPSLRTEQVCIFAPKVFSSVHVVYTVCDYVSLWNKYWMRAVWSASHWESCIFVGNAEIGGYRRQQTQHYFEVSMLQNRKAKRILGSYLH